MPRKNVFKINLNIPSSVVGNDKSLSYHVYDTFENALLKWNIYHHFENDATSIYTIKVFLLIISVENKIPK